MKAIIYLLMFLFSISLIAKVDVIKMNGKVFANGKQVKIGDTLSYGAKVQAIGPKSFIYMRQSNGNKFLLRDGAIVLDSKKESKKKNTVTLLKGIFSVHKIKKNKKKLFVRTKQAVMGIRGTKFFINEDSEKEETYLCVCDGKVAAFNKSGSVLVEKGEDTRITKDSKLLKSSASVAMKGMATENFRIMDIVLEW